MEHIIINKTKITGVFEIIEFRLSGYHANGSYDFHYRQGLYKKCQKNSSSVSFSYKDLSFKDANLSNELEETIQLSEIPTIFKMFDGCDLFGFSTNGLQNAQYFIKNDPASKVIEYLKKSHNVYTNTDELDTVIKFNNYNFALWYIKKVEETVKPFIEEFRNELRKYFNFEIETKVSPKLFGSINSTLNGLHNAIPFKYMSEEEKKSVTLEPLLTIFKNNPNSEYNYKIKESTKKRLY